MREPESHERGSGEERLAAQTERARAVAGQTVFFATQPGPLLSVAADASGNLVSLEHRRTYDPSVHPQYLARWNRDGAQEWRRLAPFPQGRNDTASGSLSISPQTGAIFAPASASVGELRFPDNTLVRYRPDASFAERLQGAGDEGGFRRVVFNDHGLRIVVKDHWLTGRVSVFRADDSIVWELSSVAPSPNEVLVRNVRMSFHQTAFDPFGNVYVVGTPIEPFTLAGVRFGEGRGSALIVLKFSPAGDLLWGRELSPAAKVTAQGIGVSAKGTLVLGGLFSGSAVWEGTMLQTTTGGYLSFLLVIEANGNLRWVKRLRDPGTTSIHGYHLPLDSILAVDPVGKVTVVENRPGASCEGAFVSEYNLAGDLLWERQLRPAPCDGRPRLVVSSLTWNGQRAIAVGSFLGTVDFGQGPHTSQPAEAPENESGQGFLLGFEPAAAP